MKKFAKLYTLEMVNIVDAANDPARCLFKLSMYCDGCNLNSKPRLLLNWWSRTV